MPEYIIREAAMPDGFCVGVSCQECPFCDDPIKGGCKVARFIDAIPAADVVEVVRCGECIYLEKDSKFDMTGDGNEDARFCGIIGCCTNDDWFCADGERKDGGQDDV